MDKEGGLKTPPRHADRFLVWFCRDDLIEEIQGDLHEYYYAICLEKRQWLAGLLYWYHVFHFLRPFAIRKSVKNSNHLIMFKFNLMIAWRNMLKHKFYSFLNISGLTIGVASFLLIIYFVVDELNYDRFFPNYERIYRVGSDLQFGDIVFHGAVAPAPMAKSFKADFPEIEASGRIRTRGSSLVRKGDEFVKLDRVAFVDQAILDIFQLDFLYGESDSALAQPNSVVLSATTARKFFNDGNPVGETLIIDRDKPVTVAGVYRDIPLNAHFHFDMMETMLDTEERNQGLWLSNNFYTYFLLDETNDAEGLQGKFPSVYRKYFEPQLSQFVGVSWEMMEQSDSRINYYLQPLKDIHLYSNLDIELEANGSIETVYMLSAIALFILLIACVNFMNLSTARAANRAKEVGMRKVMGSQKKHLVFQFLTEAVLYSFIAFVLAVALSYILLPAFNSFTGKSIANPVFGPQQLWIYVLLAMFAVGILAGLYPAFVLSSFRPLRVLKGQLSLGMKSGWLRGVLVVFQFTTSIILIVGAIVIYSQLNYAQKKKLGYDRQQVMVVNDVYALGSQITSMKEELLTNPRISNVTVTSYLPTSDARSDSPWQRNDATVAEESVSLQNWQVDVDYIKALGMKVIQGRDFSADLASDSASVILNEAAARKFGFENPIGQKIKTLGQFTVAGHSELTIIGIVEDFHIESIRQAITPMMLYLGASNYSMAIRFQSEEVSTVIAEVGQVWDGFAPNQPFEYHFMDERFQAMYDAEQRLGSIFALFATLAIVIACLGLFGLSSYTVEQKKKEIGIRKVLGASVTQIVGMLFGSFNRFILIAVLIGIPSSYMAMDRWLADFAYRIDIGVVTFIVATLLIILIAWLTVSVQSIRAARMNPSRNLRYE